MPDNAEVGVDQELRDELARLIVETLDLEDVKADDIDPREPLFGDGLGLDSIDALEMSFEITQKYGFKLRSDDERNEEIFASLNSLTRHIAENRKS
ncbi:MAG: acyl carrier protein [Rhodospirillaceae bacterium]|jgi:acyl carrier protein|nr:acyl carrier protein [Rhodospirillaceae bacterium]